MGRIHTSYKFEMIFEHFSESRDPETGKSSVILEYIIGSRFCVFAEVSDEIDHRVPALASVNKKNRDILSPGQSRVIRRLRRQVGNFEAIGFDIGIIGLFIMVSVKYLL